jgi:hypothetical protein
METMKKRVILATKKALINICQEKALEYLQIVSGEELCLNLHDIFGSLISIEGKLLDSALNVMSYIVNENM